MAEKADRDKPMNFEGAAVRYDGLRQVTVIRGDVLLTKGTIRIRGEQLEVRQDPEGNQYAVVTGSATAQAFFRQKLEGVNEFIEGEANTIEYDGRADTVKFVRSAQLRRFRGDTVADEISGGLIVYNNVSDTFSVDGSPATGGSAPTPGPGRVRGMLVPKPSASGTAPVSPPAALRPSSALGGATK